MKFGVSGFVELEHTSREGIITNLEFSNAIMNYGLEFLANTVLVEPEKIFSEMILSDGNQTITFDDINPNVNNGYFRSSMISDTLVSNRTMSNNGAYSTHGDAINRLEITLVTTAEFNITNANENINIKDELFPLREISLMVAHHTNNFNGSNSAVFAKTKIKDSDGKAIDLMVRTGETLRVNYTIKVSLSTLINNLTGNTSFVQSIQFDYNPINTNKQRSMNAVDIENDQYILKKVQSNVPNEAVYNFMVKNPATLQAAVSNGNRSNQYIGIPLGFASLKIWLSNYYRDFSRLFTTYNQPKHLKILYSREFEEPDMDIATFLSKVNISKLNNTQFSYSVPNGTKIYFYLNGTLNTSYLPTHPTNEIITGTDNFDYYYQDSPFYDVYLLYKDLPLVYYGVIKGVDMKAPTFIDNRWVSDREFQFYTEKNSTIMVTLFRGGWDDLEISISDINLTDGINQSQRDKYGTDLKLWDTISLKPFLFNNSNSLGDYNNNPYIGKYILRLPLTLKEYQYFNIKATDEYGNTATSGDLYTTKVDYQPNDFYLDNALQTRYTYGYNIYTGTNTEGYHPYADMVYFNSDIFSAKIED